MRRAVPFVCFLILLPLVSFAQKLISFEQGDKYGYVNEDGKVILKPQFPFVFSDTITNIGFVCDSKSKQILCINNLGEPLFYTFNYDNGPDYPSEGLFRIVSETGLIGYSDVNGNIVISPIYKFAYPFKNGKAKVASEGCAVQQKEYVRWEGDKWYYILNPLKERPE